MTLTAKENLLKSLVRAAGLRDVGAMTRTEVAAKLTEIKARSRRDALKKIAAAFDLPEFAVEKCS